MAHGMTRSIYSENVKMRGSSDLCQDKRAPPSPSSPVAISFEPMPQFFATVLYNLTVSSLHIHIITYLHCICIIINTLRRSKSQLSPIENLITLLETPHQQSQHHEAHDSPPVPHRGHRPHPGHAPRWRRERAWTVRGPHQVHPRRVNANRFQGSSISVRNESQT